jgi:hypothetical protein
MTTTPANNDSIRPALLSRRPKLCCAQPGSQHPSQPGNADERADRSRDRARTELWPWELLLPEAVAQPPYLCRVMTQGGSAWALRAGEVFCWGVAESPPCP